MKSTLVTLIFWALPIMVIAANNDETPAPASTDSSPDMITEPPTVLWDECNMQPDDRGVLRCYRMLSDLSEQDYYFLDDREYAYYPLAKD